jgi:hypothetical protein
MFPNANLPTKSFNNNNNGKKEGMLYISVERVTFFMTMNSFVSFWIKTGFTVPETSIHPFPYFMEGRIALIRVV